MFDRKLLLDNALTTMQCAYAPYSNFFVGAALLCKNGNIYTGCNIENSSYSATVCAERVAFSNAISQGEKEFIAIAIVGGKDRIINTFCSPCGICRQVMSEFCNKDFKILLYNGKEINEYCLNELFPLSFGRDNLC